MKTIISATVAAATLSIAAPALGQTTGYANLGYNHIDGGDATVGEVQGRLGMRFGRHVGVEGEAGLGVKNDEATVGGVTRRVESNPTAAAYGVGYLPIGERADIFARVGYGASRYRTTTGNVSVSDVQTNINYGVGAQYFLTDKDGVRVDYTRKDFNNDRIDDADSVSAAYVRRF
jgi:outer membrane immunogenic protein